MGKKLIGLVEKVKVIGEKEVDTYALFDTGASRTSIDTKIANKAKLGPIIKTVHLKHASLKHEIKRPVVRAVVNIKGRMFDVRVSIQDRAHMTFPMIVGRDILAGNFLVDPDKNKILFRKKVKKPYQLDLKKYVNSQ